MRRLWLRLVSTARFAAEIWDASFERAFSNEAGELASPCARRQQCARGGDLVFVLTFHSHDMLARLIDAALGWEVWFQYQRNFISREDFLRSEQLMTLWNMSPIPK